MLVNLSKAKALCTAAEWQLLFMSTLKRLEGLTMAQLRAKIGRARKLRDKYRKLAHQQKREKRGKASPRSSRRSLGNENTAKKSSFFAAALGRFESRLKELVAEERAIATKNKKKPAKSSGKGASNARRSSESQADKKPPEKPQSTNVQKVSRKPSVIVAMAAASSSGKPLRMKSERTRAMRARGRQDNANFTKIHAHVSARGRRNQAKRDSK